MIGNIDMGPIVPQRSALSISLDSRASPSGGCFAAVAHEQALVFEYLLEAMMEPLVVLRCVDDLACRALYVRM
jgi:hypothetical protein